MGNDCQKGRRSLTEKEYESTLLQEGQVEETVWVLVQQETLLILLEDHRYALSPRRWFLDSEEVVILLFCIIVVDPNIIVIVVIIFA